MRRMRMMMMKKWRSERRRMMNDKMKCDTMMMM
jgi:hypothetical protein